ncbi:MAG: kynureninase [bacterium]
MSQTLEPTLEFARNLDALDPLAQYRDRFHYPPPKNGHECIYFCGNSLGLQPRTVRPYVEQELRDWARLGVEGHFHAKNPWLPYHELLTEQTALLVGAQSIEVVVMNSLTVNLHLLMVSFYRPTPSRYKILIEGGAFPSDQYAVKSQLQFHGFDPAAGLLELKPRDGEHLIRVEDIEHVLAREGERIALILFGGVNYATGQVFDMKNITRLGHDHGCLVGFDLAHAAGNLELQLHDWNVDFAAWCSYKYLNAGPGSVAGCFVHERHAHRRDLPRFAGWWGHNKNKRFLMEPEFEPIPGAEGWQLSNPPILQLAALRAALEIFDEAGMKQVRAKSVLLTRYLEYLLEQNQLENLHLVTPRAENQRGAQLSLQLQKFGKRVCDGLLARHAICDWREPDLIRVAPVPLYNTFEEVYRFVDVFKQALGAGH